jgi:transposase-like protein
MNFRISYHGAFPNNDAIYKILYLGLQDLAKKWTRPIQNWKAALNQFVILFGEWMPT